MSKYIYTYLIENIVDNKFYIGSRCSNIPAVEDLGKRYFSSSSDVEFIKLQKQKPDWFVYRILGLFNTRIDAIKNEIDLHNAYNVGINKRFYNKAKQTSHKFDTTGIKQSNETCVRKSVAQKRIKRNTAIAKTIDGKIIGCVPLCDVRWKTGEIVGINKNRVVVRDILGNKFTISSDDERLESGELVGHTKGNTASNKGKRCSIDTKRKMSESAKHRGISEKCKINMSVSRKNKLAAIDMYGNRLGNVSLDDPRWKNGIIIAAKTKK